MALCKLQCVTRHLTYPVLAVERTQGCHLPLLYVSCAPVIQQNKPEYGILCIVNAEGVPKLVARPHKGSLLSHAMCYSRSLHSAAKM